MSLLLKDGKKPQTSTGWSSEIEVCGGRRPEEKSHGNSVEERPRTPPEVGPLPSRKNRLPWDLPHPWTPLFDVESVTVDKGTVTKVFGVETTVSKKHEPSTSVSNLRV